MSARGIKREMLNLANIESDLSYLYYEVTVWLKEKLKKIGA